MNTIENNNQIVQLQSQGDTEKRTRFVSVASKRTSNVLNNMNVLQKCFDQNTYDYTDEQVTKILGALEAKIAELRSASELGTGRTQFSL
ncbi:MAG: hypothetical protein VX597_00600 [Pseudomonadota bacterium]|nr:hypothetical protein [Pseudomonadota bacterium]